MGRTRCWCLPTPAGTISLTAYDKDLNQLWQHAEHRAKDYFGHYIYPYDVNGDGVDEVVISHLCLDAHGHEVWNNAKYFEDNHDHMDAMEFFDMNGDGKPELLVGQSGCGHAGLQRADRRDALAEPVGPHAADHGGIHSGRLEDAAGGGERADVCCRARPRTTGAAPPASGTGGDGGGFRRAAGCSARARSPWAGSRGAALLVRQPRAGCWSGGLRIR